MHTHKHTRTSNERKFHQSYMWQLHLFMSFVLFCHSLLLLCCVILLCFTVNHTVELSYVSISNSEILIKTPVCNTVL